MDIRAYLKRNKELIDTELKKYFRGDSDEPGIISCAMKYSVFSGGKRLRPVLCIASGEMCGAKTKDMLPTCCGIEMIHTYSLIHDDLPAMDDDDYRRGKLTSHKKFGEGIAILAGDGLLTKAFEIINPKVVREIASAAGTKGMVGGQVVDLLSERGKSEVPRLWRDKLRPMSRVNYIHRHKTAKMIEVSVISGAIIAGVSQDRINSISDYGMKIGLAFQIIDDILDIVGDKKKLGKNGSDKKNNKLTYPLIYGLENSKKHARRIVAAAKKDIRIFGKKAAILEEIADYIVNRDY